MRLIILLFTLILCANLDGQNNTPGIIKLNNGSDFVDDNNLINSSEYNKMPPCGANAANDNFASSQLLTVNGGSVNGNACGTIQAGEVLGCNSTAAVSVWYRFVATGANAYVKIDLVAGACFFGSSIFGGINSLPTNSCVNQPLSCQMAASGPATQIHFLNNLVAGQTYYIQITYSGAGGCAANAANFNIGVTSTNPGGYITNPPPINSCAAPGSPCYFTSPPSVATVTSGCTNYSLNALSYSANAVWNGYFQFTNSPLLGQTQIQAIITSNCGGGNVNYLNWTLYNSSCGLIGCGNLSSLNLSGVACGVTYIIQYQAELANCTSFVNIWPYQNAPTGATPCTILPIELLYFTSELSNSEINCKWQTISEIRSREYRLYKSHDYVNFELLHIQKSNNSSGIYNFKDNQVDNQGTVYYKLEHIDMDGNISYSKINAVVIKNNQNIITFSPNPASDRIEMVLGDDYKNTSFLIEVFDGKGSKVLSEIHQTNSKILSLDISSLKKGIYSLNIIANNNLLSCTRNKLIKN